MENARITAMRKIMEELKAMKSGKEPSRELMIAIGMPAKEDDMLGMESEDLTSSGEMPMEDEGEMEREKNRARLMSSLKGC